MRKVDVRYTLLLDYYGALLPKKQFEIADLYYNDDLSLSEIAEEKGITRQAVRDSLDRTEKGLRGYEDILGLTEKDKLVIRIREASLKLKSCYDEKLIDEIIEACDSLSLK